MFKFENKQTLFILLLAIFILGTFLRFYNLSSFPVGFHMDEASKGYSAYSLLKTGRDDNNNIFPLIIDMFGDNSPAGYHYLTILPVAVFGLNEFAVRFPGALFGSLSILAFYFLVYSIFKDKKISILSSLLLAVSPWHINISRASNESLVALFFIMSGFSLVFWSLKTQAAKHLLTGIVLLSISFLFYQTPKLFVPFLFFVLLLFFLRVWKLPMTTRFKRMLIGSFFALILVVAILFFIVPGGTGRFNQLNIFNYPETRLVLEEQIRNEGTIGTSPFVTRLFHNKIINYGQTYIANYLQYFSLNFLFVKDMPTMYQVPGMGMLYIIELPFVLIGIVLLAVNKNKFYKIPVIWLLIGPTAAAITYGTNNIQRSLVMYPMFEIITAYTLLFIFTEVIKKRKKLWLTIISLLFIFNFTYFLHQYFGLAKVYQPWYRNNGFAKMMAVINKNYNNYDRIVSTKSQTGYPLFQFYTKYGPLKYQQEGSPKDADYKGFGKFIFVPQDCPSISDWDKFLQYKNIIFIDSGNCPENIKVSSNERVTILREDNSSAFKLIFVHDYRIPETK